ncbi:fasciclin domain-containing protein [Phenylobacterium sp.]|uniref:fasciclin domain-containing protein n=1 Tax=Phenylobacterium sp. TaxID=1871053 RepID=UPI00301B9552
MTRFLLAAAAVAALSAAPMAAQAQDAAPAAGPIAVQGDLVDTLKLSGRFNTFVGGIDATNLTGLLKTNKNLTVFAPTDAAFAAMPADKLAQLKSDKAAMQRFVLHHVVNAPIDSAKIKGAKGPIPSGAGDTILLDGSDEGGKLKVDGATIVQADLHTGSGLLHVVDRVLVAGEGDAEAPAAPAS